MICKIDGWVLGGVQFGELVQVLIQVPVTAWAHFYKIDGRVQRYAAWVLAQVLFWGCLRCW